MNVDGITFMLTLRGALSMFMTFKLYADNVFDHSRKEEDDILIVVETYNVVYTVSDESRLINPKNVYLDWLTE